MVYQANTSELTNQQCLFPGDRGDFSARSILHRREQRTVIGSLSKTSNELLPKLTCLTEMGKQRDRRDIQELCYGMRDLLLSGVWNSPWSRSYVA